MFSKQIGFKFSKNSQWFCVLYKCNLCYHSLVKITHLNLVI